MEYISYLGFGQRCLDATTCRFTSVDRFSEKYAFQTPFSYAASNPLKFIDVNGDSIRIAAGNGDYAYYDNGKLYHSNGSQYTGAGTKVEKDGTIKLKGNLKATVKALDAINSGGNAGRELVNRLVKSSNTTTITPSNKNRTFNFNVEFNPRDFDGGLNTAGNTSRPPFIGLAHELVHVMDYDINGRVDNTVWFRVNGKPVFNAEKFASNYENLIRAENSLPLRTNYTDTSYPSGALLKGNRAIYQSTYYSTRPISSKVFTVKRN